MNTREEGAYFEFAARCEAARAQLWSHMADRGLRKQDGWLIYEFTRQVEHRTELVMRPIHRELTAPPDLECVCTIDETSGDSSSDCLT